MDYSKSKILSLGKILICCILVLKVVEGQQNDVTLQILQNLQNQINAVNATNINYQNQINQLNTQLQNQIAKENSDFQIASQSISGLQGDLAFLSSRVTATEDGLENANGRISVLEQGLVEALARVTKLESVNKIWRANFQVVNKTFAELRRKFKLAIPVLQLPVFVVRAG